MCHPWRWPRVGFDSPAAQVTKMLLRLFLLFTIVPIVELWLLFQIAQRTSLWFTLGLVIVTGFLGAWLARLEGWRTVARIQRELSEGKLPGDALVDGLLILVAGAVLITPGVLTDILGFGLLLPPVRRLIKARLQRRFADRFVVREYPAGGTWHAASRGSAKPSGEIIDARVIEEADEGDPAPRKED